MKQKSVNRVRKYFLFVCVIAFVLCGSLYASAAVKAPAKVENLKGTAKDKAVKLTWSKVPKAEGYHVYLYDTKQKKFVRVEVIRKRSITSTTVEKLKNGVSYRFRVSAYRMGDNNVKAIGKRSDIISVTPKKPYLSAPEVRVTKEGNKTVTVKWNKVKNAVSYDVALLRKDTKKKSFPAKEVKKKKIVLEKLKNDVTYKIAVRANAKVNGKAVHSEWTSVEATPFNPDNQKRLLSQINHVSAYGGGTEPRLVYPDNVAEAFANYGNNGSAFHSNTDYFLWLNTHGLHLYIFKRSSSKRWKVLYKFPCAIGRPGSQTPSGLWILDTKQYKDDHGSFYVLYCTFFTGYDTNSIHSQCYPVQQDPLLEGYFGSAGCVRCDLKYAQFVYENCEGSPFLVR